MSTWTKLKCLIPGRRRAFEQDIQEELESLARLAEADGRRTQLGNLTRVAENSRAVWTWIWLEEAAADIRYALRAMRTNPFFTATAVLSLALGIGANTAIFSLINAMLLKPLPLHDPDSLVVLTSHSSSGKVGDFGYADYLALRQDNSAFTGIVAASRLAPVSAGIASDAGTVQRKIVSDNYFSVLGVHPSYGRVFSAGQDDLPLAVISHGWWTRAFGGNAGVIGQTIELDGRSFEIVGVAPPGFLGETVGEAADVWTTVTMMPPEMRRAPGYTWMNLMGRLNAGVSYQQAAASLQARTPQFFNRFIERVEIEPGRNGGAGLRNSFALPLKALMAIVAIALLMACANLAGLLLARSASRRREIATRLAIGASRGRLFRQFITESVRLAIIAGVAGIAFAAWGQRLILALMAGLGRTISIDLRPDTSVLLFTLLVSLLTAVLFGLAPAIEAVRDTASETLKLGASGGAIRRDRAGLRGGLVALQISLSMLLLVVGGLFVRTMQNLRNQDIGVDAHNVLSVLIEGRRGERLDWTAIVSEITARLESVPGIRTIGGSLFGTLANAGGVTGFRVEGYTAPAGEEQRAGANWITPGYFRAVGIPLVAGRDFSHADHPNAPAVAIVNQSMARHYFAGTDQAIGRAFVLNAQRYAIVGVARDAKYSDLRESQRSFVYFPALQAKQQIRSLEIRTAGSPAEIAHSVRQIIRQVDARLRIVDAATLDQRIGQKLAREELIAKLAAFFGGLTLLLVIIGAYGMLACSVARNEGDWYSHRPRRPLLLGSSNRPSGPRDRRLHRVDVRAGARDGGLTTHLVHAVRRSPC